MSVQPSSTARRPRRLVRLGLALALAGLPVACAGAGAQHAPPQAPSLVVQDLDGRTLDPLQDAARDDARMVVLLFVLPDCPISNVYVPEYRRLLADYEPRGVAFYLVYPDADLTSEAIALHLEDYELPLKALRDPEQVLVAHTGATKTPEAAVLSPGGEVRYLGRVDDLYVDFGKRREVASRLDLRNALDALLADRAPDPAHTQAVGCFIPLLEDTGL